MVPDEPAADSSAAVRGVHHDSRGKFHGRCYRRLPLHAPVDSAGHTVSRRQVFTIQARLVFLDDTVHGYVII